jgi:hypothetical protein
MTKNRKIIIVGMLLVTIGVVFAINWVFPFSKNVESFGQEVSTWSLDGQSSKAALNMLSEKGFKVGQYKAEPYFNDQRDYIYATQRRVAAMVCSREWRIILKLENEKVVNVKPLVYLHCL